MTVILFNSVYIIIILCFNSTAFRAPLLHQILTISSSTKKTLCILWAVSKFLMDLFIMCVEVCVLVCVCVYVCVFVCMCVRACVYVVLQLRNLLTVIICC